MSRPIHRSVALGFALILGAAGLAGCGSSNDDNGSDAGGSGDASGEITAVCNLDSLPQSSASAPPTGAPSSQVSGKVGVILPDTTSSTRYTEYDQPLLQKALSAAGIDADIQNAQGDNGRFAQIASTMIGQGVQVLIIDSGDPATGAGVEKEAAAAGVKVIDYDRVNLGGTADYYVSFDNEEVGKLQAQTMVDCLHEQGIANPRIIMMDGGTDIDNNAVLFAKGAHEVLDPLVSQGAATIVDEKTVAGWKTENAANIFQASLTSAGGSIDGVVAANDDIANAVIGVLKGVGLDGHVVITGQDSGTEGLGNIIKGEQSMTIFKNVSLEANAAAKLAIALISGNPSDSGLTLSKFDDPKDSSHDIQALLLPSQVIVQSNVSDVVDAGALTAAQICKGITSECSAAGLN